ncbi:hypothetical protein PVX_001850 [Plasmodium vivax]|uniref:Uncharacterized protein n=1 Tax=Plasmodium vivax (strain Salvador I) TaxID=126793 RepID=A5KCE0_PLAVS|nr:hypothetical protein PVX_001850 [Plasmodium vivax]EDL43004.1 hypothetical protein PVX_001850 [Plasmodium vivax]|eukprot:XP_001612731.1 hypothetical protein [Plasmodium vivax Sal-1]
MSGTEEAPRGGAAVDRGGGDSIRGVHGGVLGGVDGIRGVLGGVNGGVLGGVHGDARSDLHDDVHVTSLGGEGSQSQGAHTEVKLDGVEGQDREGGGLPDGISPVTQPQVQVQPCWPPEVPNGDTPNEATLNEATPNGATPNEATLNEATPNGATPNEGCEGTAEPRADYATETIANAKEILRNSNQYVMREPKLEADELNGLEEILHSKDGEVASVVGGTIGGGTLGGVETDGHAPASEPNDANMTALLGKGNSSLPFILKGISETLNHILTEDKMKNRNKNKLIQVVQNAHMLLRSKYNLVLKCDSNLATIVKKIKRLYRLYRKLDVPAGMSRRVPTSVGVVGTDVLPVGRIARGERQPVGGAPTQGNANTSASNNGGEKEVRRNDPSSDASSVGCRRSWNVGGGEGNEEALQSTLQEKLLNGGPLQEAPLHEVAPPAMVTPNEALPHARHDTTTVEGFPQGDTKEDGNCDGKEDHPLGAKQLSYSFVKGDEGRSYKNLTSIDSKSTAMSTHKEDTGSSVTTEGRGKKIKPQRGRTGGGAAKAANAASAVSAADEAEMHPARNQHCGHPTSTAHYGHPARSPTKERNKNKKKKEREKKRILHELSKLNALFFFTFNHKGDIINYLHREISSSISEFDAAYQLYVSK